MQVNYQQYLRVKRRDFFYRASIGLSASYLPVALTACSTTKSSKETSEAETYIESETAKSNVPNEEGYLAIGTDQELNENGYLIDSQSNVIVFRDGSNNLSALSLLCTHQGCNVDWKKSSNSLACPCHGSEFAVDGEVINGPAQSPLATFEVKEENQSILVKVG